MARYTDDKRDQDRAKIPTRCPECGSELEVVDMDGAFHVYGPADRKLALESHGIKAENGDVIAWQGLNAYCPNHDWQLYWAMATTA